MMISISNAHDSINLNAQCSEGDGTKRRLIFALG